MHRPQLIQVVVYCSEKFLYSKLLPVCNSYILVKQPGESDAGPCIVGVEVVVQVGEVEAEAVWDVYCHFVSA